MRGTEEPVRELAREPEWLGVWLPRGRVSIGRVVVLRGRTFEIVGVDPVSVRPRRVYLEDAATGSAAVAGLEASEE